MRDLSTDVPGIAALAGLTLPVAVVAIAAWNRRWVGDDGFINVRIVENIVDGHGPVFNAGERVEAGTSALWLAVLAIARGVAPFVSIPKLAVGLGLVFTLLGLAAAMRGAILLWRAQGQHGTAVPVGVVVLAALAPVWDFATGGLETGLTFLWLGASFLLLARGLGPFGVHSEPPPAWRLVVPAVVIGLGPLVRPDLGLIALTFGVALLAQSRRTVRSWLGGIGVAAALPLAYEVFRAGYYASLVPNTALAKSAGSASWAQGIEYLRDFVDPYLLALPAVIVVAFLAPLVYVTTRRGDAASFVLTVAPILGGLMHVLYVVRVGGDFMHGRMLLPGAMALLLPVAAVVVGHRALLRPFPLVPLAALVLWAMAVGAAGRVQYEGSIGPDGIADERGWHVVRAGTEHPMSVDDYDNDQLPWYRWAATAADAARRGQQLFIEGDDARPGSRPGVVVRMQNIGIFGVRAGSRVYVADNLSLAHAVGAHLAVPPAVGSRIGHAHFVPLAWDLARFAAPQPGDGSDVAAARRALGCGPLRELIDDVTAPLTIGRFFGNVLDAPRLTRLKVPSDPHAAAARLCR